MNCKLSTLTKTLAEYIQRIHYKSLPLEAVERVKTVMVDTIGVMICASRKKAGRIAVRLVRELEDKKKLL